MTNQKLREWQELDQEGRERCRVDFSIEVLSTDDTTQMAEVALKPDPRRYEVSSKDGERIYIDKYLRIAIPHEVVNDMMRRRLEGQPISYNPPSISSASEYAKSRKVALQKELDGSSYSPPNEKARSQKDLFADTESSFVSFLSIDIVGSTALRQKHGKKYDQSYRVFLRELLTSVGHFHASVLRVTGDGFIAFIDLPAFTLQCDNTIDLGLTLLRVLRESVNPNLEQSGLPTLDIRVGADAGTAVKRSIDIEATNFSSFDIGSAALNRAVKIEQFANAGQFLIGRALYELVHVEWLERCQQVPFDGQVVGIDDYPVYSVS